MNIFKEMALSIYSYKSYKRFLGNKSGKVFGFGLVLVLCYFFITMVIPLVGEVIKSGSIGKNLQEIMPDFELKDGVLWVDDVIEYDYGDQYIYIDTDPEYVFYNADEMQYYLYGYSEAILMDSEKMIIKTKGQVQELYFSDIAFQGNKETLLKLVPFLYLFIIGIYIFLYVCMTALFFFGVLFVALMGMIVASCMQYRLTFGQLYLLGIYSRTLPLLIKAAVSFLPFNIPFFFIINFGLSLLIIGCAIQKMKEQELRQPLEFTT